MAPNSQIASGRRSVVLWLGLATLVLGGLSGWARAETPVAFSARLEESIRRVEDARERGAPLDDPDVHFPAQEELTLGRGTVAVDHTSLRAEWRAIPRAGDLRREALGRLCERLRAVRGELAAAQAVADRGGGDPPPRWREELSRILARPEFTKREAQVHLLDQAVAWLLDKLGAFFPWKTAQAVSRVIDWIVYLVAGAALLALAVVLVRVAIPLFRRDVPFRRAASAEPETARETPEALLALAETRSRADDFRGAAQAMFCWMLATLHRTGRLDYDPALTNREHLARLRTEGTARTAFAELAEEFELVWYALRPVSRDDYDGFRGRCVALAGGRP